MNQQNQIIVMSEAEQTKKSRLYAKIFLFAFAILAIFTIWIERW